MESHKLGQARSLQRAGRLEEAVIVLESLLAGEPGNPVALTQLARLGIEMRVSTSSAADSAVKRASRRSAGA